MSKLDEQEKRIAQILSDGVINEDNLWKTSKTLNKYFKYLKNNLDSPCIMTGIESYPWEESYVFGYGSKKEYEKLKKDNPSYKDIFELVAFENDVDEQILVKVKRQSDKKKFIIELDCLKAIEVTSKNYQALDDYSVWYVNY
jgi:hypothetical protein